jgi:hypothetical protein
MTLLDTERTTPRRPNLGGSVWNTFTSQTRVSARGYVDEIAVLLQGVLASNGFQHPEILIDQLRTTLSLGGPHSSIPIPAAPARSSTQLLVQAVRIGDQLATWAEEALTRLIDEPAPLNAPLQVRSHCDGHTLIRPAIHILLGPQGGPVPMMLFNEWIHQMVLLRDALLPFGNWDEVLLPVDGTGLRRLETPRERFLSEVLLRQVRHTSIVAYARNVLVPGNDVRIDGYGFAYAGGTVLPAVAGAHSILTDSYLLTWSPEGAVDVVETYVPRESSYFEARRTAARALPHASDPPPVITGARIVEAPAGMGVRHAAIELTIAGRDAVAVVDLGQALRGHRFAYPTESADASAPRDAEAWLSSARVLDAVDVLTAEGLVWDERGDYSIDVRQDGLVALALLGAIYPENVIVRGSAEQTDPSTAGKTGPARFVLTLPDAAP